MPSATPRTVRSHVASGRLQPVYLLLGDNDRLLGSLATAIADTLEEDLRVFNHERLYATDKEVTPASVVEAASIAPMMSPRRVVTVLRAERWLKPKRGAAEAAEGTEAPGDAEADAATDRSTLAPLIEYLKNPMPSTVLVLVACDANRTTAAVKALYKSATVVECWGLGDEEGPRAGDPVRQALKFIKDTAAASGRQFEPAAAQLLAERSGADAARLRADLDRVLLFVTGQHAIARADVEAVVSDRETVQDPWAIVNAIERGHAPEALRLLAAALEEGAVPYMVLGQLAWFVRDKLPRVRPRMVPAAVQAVFRTDIDLKSSGGEPRVLLERLVLELCGGRKR